MVFSGKTHIEKVLRRPDTMNYSFVLGMPHQGMTRHGTKVLVGLLAISLLLGGCATRVSQFKGFSEAGVAYADTMGKLLKESGGVSIDADSAALIETRSDMSTGHDGARDITLGRHNELLKKRLVILGDISEHGRLLKSYFEALAALAGSNVGTDIATTTKGIVDELGKLNPRLSNAKLGSAPIGSLVGPVTGMVVAGFQQAALEKELKTNAQTIERELELQTVAIKAVAEIWKTDQKTIVGGEDINNREQFLQDKALPGNWATNRKRILIVDNSTELADSATDASKKLKEAFVKLVQNKVSIEDIPLMAKDLEKVLSLIELIKTGPST